MIHKIVNVHDNEGDDNTIKLVPDPASHEPWPKLLVCSLVTRQQRPYSIPVYGVLTMARMRCYQCSCWTTRTCILYILKGAVGDHSVVPT